MAPPAFHAIYPQILEHILEHGVIEKNERTGRNIRMAPPISLSLNLSNRILPVPGIRKVFPGTAAAEIAWFLRGDKTPTWLQKYCKIWDLFIEEDGTIGSAYGYRWRHHFGRDQIKLAADRLATQPSDRQVIIMAWDPAQDGLGTSRVKNVPCPLMFQLTVIGNALNMILYIRSSDVFVGLPYDVMGHALLLDAFAAELGLTPQVMHITLAHPHVYDGHWDEAREALKHFEPGTLHMPGTGLTAIEQYPEDYVQTVKDLAGACKWPDFCPRPEIVQ